jgi:2-iminobutanoate/2-iminopropanoate deaminase
MKKLPLNASKAPMPVSKYAQAMKVSDATEWVFVSGQIPVTTAGDVPASFMDQAKLVWANVMAQLDAAGMTADNLIKVTIYLCDRKYALENRQARELALGDRTPALTCIITGIFDNAWLLEIEAIAAR